MLTKLKDGKVVLIRQAMREDATGILGYIEKVAGETDFLTFGPGEFNMSVEDEEKFIEIRLDSVNQLLLVAEIEGEIVGALSFSSKNRPRILHRGEVGVSVLKAYWGLGIGKGLLESLIGWAKSNRIIKKINLKVRCENMRAIRLYERQGFVSEGVVSREYFIAGKFYDALLMGLEVNSK
jgi:RimJ/RimL family protein N-acetyltransferase